MTRYYRVPGMMHPYWIVSEAKDWPHPGDVTTVAMNSAASTDMGDLYGDEFFQCFPHAVEITKEQYEARA
ncbi:hypothetical protein PBI_ESTAVE1_37 [Mycobacterium phage Estave1]|uniref:Uncharacterized protein n=3 Tax=Gracegardnervirinae TaxID=2946632 RepID=A0A385DZL9_9CAUD|nr:hypothetical protein PBI_WEE_40 [Mycobacterium phage Wee]YP_009124228.1 hypothetical protein PBI_ESTAVE1_37 [Mycobacterium phage Estave1]YP_009841065.1 hypothetical protein HWB85_gp040 [Mycobacterium phage Renaud18]ADU15915.1 hypothetical protein PBI_WEE_40 [Mycobacterium phage Wee]AIM40427.1 hypothetical protein PBI_ESTAVE1_37 [Mycobacterium phage Estave1]AXQ64950.1 hypothetical protein SEA_RENAUD18_40 [Mycobacterium phage Renaud18]